ncbi:hypothetical protein [Beihai picorna-like virus 68]|uniref:hypothetical protein n=1 Tax=Beihai picorna-like virus 68 TaxID=1922614 RepID=UPI00090A5B5F|nr:hypothetical protein [Beihai picorna-like virus 68]APG77925.1 hypothetical protein [Beihai picorna-like virus 68]
MTHVATKSVSDDFNSAFKLTTYQYYQQAGHFYDVTCYCKMCRNCRYVAQINRCEGKQHDERREVRKWYSPIQAPIRVGKIWTKRPYIPPTYCRLRIGMKARKKMRERPSEVFKLSQEYLTRVFGPLYEPPNRKLYKSPYDTAGPREMDSRSSVLPEGGEFNCPMKLDDYLAYREDFGKFISMLSGVSIERRMTAWKDVMAAIEFRHFLASISSHGNEFERQFLNVNLDRPTSFTIFDYVVIPEGYFYAKGFGLKESAKLYVKLSDFINKVDNLIESTIDFVFGKFGGYIKELKNIIVGFITSVFKKIGEFIFRTKEDVIDYDLPKVACYILVACLGVGFGFLTYSFLSSVIPGISDCEPEGYKPSSLSSVAMIGSIFSVFTLASGTALVGNSSNSIRYLANLSNTITSVDKLWLKILEVLPSSLVEYITVATSTEEHQEVVKWIRDAEKVVQVAKISSIFSRPEFSTAVEKLIKLTPKVVSNCANEERAIILMHYGSLMKISSTLHQGKSGASRVKPFVVHIFGDPGVGKSVNLDVIVQKLGFSPSQVYSRNCADNYWSGFMDQPVIAIDEFMNDVDEVVNLKTRSEFMYLASSVTYMPNMASVDPSSIGVKGQTANPEIVVTMNNDYCRDSPNCSDTDYKAHLRRRNVVLKCMIKPQYRKVNGQLDKDTLFETEEGKEVLKNRSWCSFVVYDPEHNGPAPRILHTFDSIDLLSECLQAEFQKHKDLSVEIAGAHAGEMNSNNIDEILDSLDFRNILAEGGFDKVKFSLSDLSTTPVSFDIPKNFSEETFHYKLLNFLKKGHTYLEKSFDAQAHFILNGIQRSLRTLTTFSPEEFPQVALEHFGNSDLGPSLNCGGITISNLFSNDKKSGYSYFGSIFRGAHCATKKLHYHQCCGVTKDGTQCGSRIYCINSSCGREFCYKSTCSSGQKEVTTPNIANATALFVEKKTNDVVDKVNSSLGWGLVTTFGVAFLAGAIFGFVRTLVKSIMCILPESAKPKKSRPVQRHSYIRPEGGSDPHVIKVIHEDERSFSMGFGIYNSTMVTISHNFLNVDGNLKYEKVILQRDSETVEFVLDQNNIKLLKEYDLVILDVSNAGFSPFKDIRKRLLRSTAHNQLECCNGTLVDLYQKTVFPTRIETAGPIVYNTAIGNCFNPEVVYKYYAETLPGSCGSMLVSKDSRFCNKIIGVHVAGQKGGFRKIGYSIPLYMEMFEQSGILDSDDTIVPENGWFETPKVEVITPMVNMPGRSKLKRSAISDDFKRFHPINRVPALLSPKDGLDPTEVFVESLEKIPQFEEIWEYDVSYVEAAMLARYGHLFEGREQKLSLHEAIRGIPGELSALDLSTSAGYPHSLVGLKKTDFITPDSISPELEQKVSERIAQIERGECPEHYWLGYFKDELVKVKKRYDGRTRVIFCGDFVTTIAFRVLYGYRILIFNNSRREMGHAIGYNQYSADMNKIFEDLIVPGKNVSYIAGDYKSFDKHHHPQVRLACFRLLKQFMGMPDNHFKFLLDYESSPMVLGSNLINDPRYHKSGTLFTTILNCLVNEFYVRYAFLNACPGKCFDDYCRIKTLGDDHIISVSTDVKFNPLILATLLGDLGQTYTDDNKEECTEEMRSFEQISFLGSIPRKLQNGKFVGVPKKSHLDGLHFTRNKNLTLVSEVQDRVDLLSLGNRTFFDKCTGVLRECLRENGFDYNIRTDYLVLQREVSDRTTGTDNDFIQAEGGLTQFHTNQQTAVEMRYPCPDISRGLKEHPYDINYGPDSCIRRSTGTWASADTAGKLLFKYRIPGDVLALGDGQNLQNMPFERHIYTKFDFEGTVQVNATNFQQGLLVLFFYPLGFPADDYHQTNWTSLPHVFVGASKSNSGTLKIDFSFPRNAINTFGNKDEEITGTLCLGVISALKTGTGTSDSATWNFYSSFKNCEFYLPRPVVSALSDFEIVGEGNVSSSVNTYNISDVAGTVPIETSLTSTQSNKNNLVPLDNPPMAGGGVPIVPQFCSMAKSVGPSTTVSLQLDQKALDRCNHFDSSNIESIVSKPCLWYARTWSTANTIGTSIVVDEMGTFKFYNSPTGGAGSRILPSSAIINMCTFWRADLVFEIVAVKTPYHSGRLTFVSAFGAPSLKYTEANVYKNEVLDFGMNSDGEDISRHKIVVPYNAPTEFLRTYEGDDAPDRLENSTLGMMGLYVTNQLRAPSSVSNTIEILIFVSFENVVLAVPRPVVFFKSGFRNVEPSQKVVVVAPRGASNIQAEGFGDDQVNSGSQEEVISVEPVKVTADLDVEPPDRPCRLNVGSKFENRITDLLEIARRYIATSPFFSTWESAVDTAARDYVTFRAFPLNYISDFFAGFSGSLKFRTFVKVDTTHEYENPIFFYPTNAPPVTVFPHLVQPGSKFKGAASGEQIETEYTYSSNYRTGFAPKEIMIATFGPKTEFIDFQIPFQSHFNYVVLAGHNGETGAVNVTSESMGVVVVPASTKSNIYQGVGDDFRYCHYRPPHILEFNPPTVTVTGTSSLTLNVGGYYKKAVSP